MNIFHKRFRKIKIALILYFIVGFVIENIYINNNNYNTYFHRESAQLDENLPYKIIKPIADSIAWQKNVEENLHLGKVFENSNKILGIKFTEINYPDSNRVNLKMFAPLHEDYLDIDYYSLKKNLQYLFKGKGGAIRFLDKMPNSYTDEQYKEFEKLNNIDVPFKYNPTEHKLQIPISVKQYNRYQYTLRFLILLIIGSVWLYGYKHLYTIIVLIYRGLAFTNVTLERVKKLAITFACFPFAILLMHLVLRCYFHQFFTKHIYFDLNLFWDKNSWYFIASLVVYGLALLVEEGYLYKKENDLTI